MPSPPSSLRLPRDHMQCSLPGLKKGSLDQQNPKYDTGASHLSLGQPLIHPEKESSTSSSDFEGEFQIRI